MTDRELLEAAARAAGMDVQWHEASGELCCAREDAHSPPRRHGDWRIWSPLTDDGDALRLAVDLRLEVWNSATDSRAMSMDAGMCTEAHGTDPRASTRRAIVRAAASMGEKA